MSVTPIHLFRQGPVLEALLRAVFYGKKGRVKGPGKVSSLPPPVLVTLPARNPGLVKDYIRHVGGSPSWYKGQLPPHFYPQWGFPPLSRVIANLPYDLTRVLNVGAGFEIRQPLPSSEALQIEARLEEIDDDGSRVILKQTLVTGTASAPQALQAHITALIPLKRSEGKQKKERPQVPEDAREVARWSLCAGAGLDFALLTGDFNPIHWVKPYARMAGFRSPVLHGFSCLARAVESLNRCLWSGDSSRLARIEVRFVRPIVLPARVGLYIDGRGGIFVGDAPGSSVYMIGEYQEKEKHL